MRARMVNESAGISWSGKDVTKAPVIGKILTRRIKSSDGLMEPEILEIVEIIENGDIYVTNQWYKPGRPLIVHKDMVGHYIPMDMYKDADLEQNFKKIWK